MKRHSQGSSSGKRHQAETLKDERKKQIQGVAQSNLFETIEENDENLVQLILARSIDREVSFLSLDTSQATMLFVDKQVAKIFEIKLWISATKTDAETGELQISLQKTLAGKRFLLVMDDVWINKPERDMFFKIVSTCGKSGSKIILTTPKTEISYLPNTILQNIFSRLPIKTVFCCKCVCKEWFELIKDPEFSKMHFSRATVYPILRTFEPRCWPSELHLIEATSSDDLVSPLRLHSKFLPPQVPFTQEIIDGDLGIPKFGIVNSCNGLICVCTTPFNNPIYVCNLVTGEYIMLPKPRKNRNTDNYIMTQQDAIGELFMTDFVVSGFGFSPKTNQYKVMRVLVLEIENAGYLIAQVLILGSSSWRTIGSLIDWNSVGLNVSHTQTLNLSEAPYRPSFCVYLNGAVHWLANSKTSPMFIGSFNFDSEEIVEILAPKQFGQAHKNAIGNMRLGVLRDCLYLSDVSCYHHFKIWVLKDYNDESSWIKEMVISTMSLDIWPRGLYRPIKYFDNGDLLMFHPSNALVCYNPKEKSFRYFKIHGIDSDFEVVPYTPSLASMKDAIHVEDPKVPILNVRDSKRLPYDWNEYQDFALVEEDKHAISAKYSKIVKENRPFIDAFTGRNW